MGTDVHPYVEVRLKTGQWKRAHITLSRDRNYVAFAVLAGVRNGFGFAGVPMFEPLTPISEPKGLPPDTSIIETSDAVDYYDPDYIWLGDHDHSWLTLAELKGYDLERKILETGVVSGPEREVVRAGGVPTSWCGSKSPMTADDEQMHWERSLRVAAHLVFDWIKDLTEFARYKYKDQDIRVVFGFDS